MIGTDAFVVADSGVSAIGWNCGGPSKLGTKLGPPVSGTVAVCGIELAITASCACGVPATAASTTAAGELVGMCAKSGGKALAGTKLHGPLVPAARNQRPDNSTK